MILTDAMKAEIKGLLEQVSQWQSCNGCNDWECKSPEVAKAIYQAVNDDPERMPPKGKLIYDFDVMALVRKALEL